MQEPLKAIIYCDKGLLDPVGKTAHGLIRHSPKYRIVGVVDSDLAGSDAGVILDGKERGIPVYSDVESAAIKSSPNPDVMIVGLAPTGFNGDSAVIVAAEAALKCGLSIHSGLHIFLSDLPQLRELASSKNLEIVDIRKPPLRRLAMFSGRILNVNAPRLLVTGQDASVGKRTASIRLCSLLEERGIHTCLIGTGQTAWLQGIKYGVRLDALPLDFAGGEVESEIVRADEIEKPDLIVIEGQGSLLNPGYSCETMILLTACRPSLLVYVAAPGRSHYEDFPSVELRSAMEEISLLETISGATVEGVIVNSNYSHSLDPSILTRGLPVSVGADGDLGPLTDRIVRSLALLRS